jgi:hypothetical protein
MTRLEIQPMQWQDLPELHATLPLDETDLVCLAELKAVLARHGKLDRFAVQLAHRHFDLAADEILVEQPDPEARTQHVSVGRRGDYPVAIPTTWLFSSASEPDLDRPALKLSDAIYCVCARPNEVDCSGHAHSSTPPPATQRERSQKEIGNPAERQTEQERIHRERSRYERGFPVAGHGEPHRTNDPGRGR